MTIRREDELAQVVWELLLGGYLDDLGSDCLDDWYCIRISEKGRRLLARLENRYAGK